MTEARSWRDCPFLPGRKYRVIESFSAMRAQFIAGEILTFERQAYSIYDSCTGYFFRNHNDQIYSLDVYDDADIEPYLGKLETMPE